MIGVTSPTTETNYQLIIISKLKEKCNQINKVIIPCAVNSIPDKSVTIRQSETPWDKTVSVKYIYANKDINVKNI